MSVGGWMLGKVVVGDDDPDLLVMLDAEDRFDLHDRLSAVAAPTLVIGGDSDGFYPEVLFRETARGIPAAQVIVYRGVGHMTTQGNRRLAADVSGFLSADFPARSLRLEQPSPDSPTDQKPTAVESAPS
jgi:pimeloyl-ACP methyl ester carboxylesterase